MLYYRSIRSPTHTQHESLYQHKSIFRDLSTIFDHHRRRSPPTFRTHLLHCLDYAVAIDNLPEYHMFPIQPCSLLGADKELGSVGVGTGIGHGQHTRTGVLLLEVLILELETIDGFTTSSIASGEVPTLAHEAWDDAMEGRALVVQWLARPPEPLLSGAETPEILSSFWGDIGKQLHHNATSFCPSN